MQDEVKEIYYIITDLLDSLLKTSKNNPSFIQINENKFNEIKLEFSKIFMRIDNGQSYYVDKKTEIIGILPSVLINKTKFPTNEDIVKLAKKSLNLSMKRWEKKSRHELIGIIISEIALMKENDLSVFLRAWRKFLQHDKVMKYDNNKDYVDTWLDYFNKFRESI